MQFTPDPAGSDNKTKTKAFSSGLRLSSAPAAAVEMQLNTVAAEGGHAKSVTNYKRKPVTKQDDFDQPRCAGGYRTDGQLLVHPNAPRAEDENAGC